MTADLNNDRAAPLPTPQHDAERAAERHAALVLYARKTAHDLNNFATVIRTYSEMLLSELPADGGTHADVSEIHRAADAMIAYVECVSRFARGGSMRINPVDVDALLADIVAAHLSSIVPVRFDSSSGAPLTAVATDPSWFADVLGELIQNACDASPPGAGVVLTRDARLLDATESFDVSSVQPGKWAIVSVIDAGAGFAESVKANAEDPFVTTKDGVRGAGFGLTLAASFARCYRGHLTRTRVGDRTVVSLWLPLAP